jgi:hypothetical protein
MTRNGKIARLPHEIRDQLNRRLYDGELQTRLVDWLNSLPETQAVLKANFEEQPSPSASRTCRNGSRAATTTGRFNMRRSR